MERCWRRLEGLAASVADWVRRLGPWPLVFTGMLWMVPVLCRRLSGDTSIGVLSYPAFCAWFRLWGQVVAAAGSIAVFGNGHWRRRSFALLLCAISIGGELTNLIALGLETARPWWLPPWVVPAVVLPLAMHSLLQAPARSAAAWTQCVAVVAGSVWLLGVMNTGFPDWTFGCMNHLTEEAVALTVAKDFALRVAIGIIAVGWASLGLWAGRQHGRRLLPLLGLCLWLGSRVFCDAISGVVAFGVSSEGDINPRAVTELAGVAEGIGFLGFGAAAVLWALAATSERYFSERRSSDWGVRGWWRLAPVAAMLVMSTSLAFEPNLRVSGNQELETPLWRDVDDMRPLVLPELAGGRVRWSPRLAGNVSGVLPGGGPYGRELHLFYGDRRGEFYGNAALARPERSPVDEMFGGPGMSRSASVLVDERTTMADLRRAADSLRNFDWMVIVWMGRPSTGGFGRARERWGAVEIVSRDLRGMPIRLVRVSGEAPEEFYPPGHAEAQATVQRLWGHFSPLDLDRPPLPPDVAARLRPRSGWEREVARATLRESDGIDFRLVPEDDDVLVSEVLLDLAGRPEPGALWTPDYRSCSRYSRHLEEPRANQDALFLRVRIPDGPEAMLLGFVVLLFRLGRRRMGRLVGAAKRAMSP